MSNVLTETPALVVNHVQGKGTFAAYKEVFLETVVRNQYQDVQYTWEDLTGEAPLPGLSHYDYIAMLAWHTSNRIYNSWVQHGSTEEAVLNSPGGCMFYWTPTDGDLSQMSAW